MRPIISIPTLVLLTLCASPMLAQTAPTTPAAVSAPSDASFKVVVTSEVAAILAGSSKAYYPVSRMPAGTLLTVADASYPSYYEIVPPSNCSAFVAKSKVEADKQSGTVKEDGAECFAAGLEKGPKESFRIQRKLSKGEKVEILETVGDFYRIKEPAKTTVYVSAAQVRKATESDLKEGPPEAKPSYKPVEKTAEVEAKETTQPIEHTDAPAVEVKPTTTTTPVKPKPEAEVTIQTPATDSALRGAEARLEVAKKAAKDKAIPSNQVRRLLTQYEALAKRTDLNEFDAQLVAARVTQLTRNLQISENVEKINAAQVEAVEANNANEALHDGFDAVGELKSSAVYNGGALPKLYRLVDCASNSTIAYVIPDAKNSAFVNKKVGIQGNIEVDAALKLRVMHIQSISEIKVEDKPVK